MFIWKDNVKIDSFVVNADQSVQKRLWKGWYWIESKSLENPRESRKPIPIGTGLVRSTIIETKDGLSIGLYDKIKVVLNCNIQV